MKKFDSLDLVEPLQRALAAQGYETMTPIQEQAIPPLLKGHDVMGCAQTGTGKTAAFLVPIIENLATRPVHGKSVIRALVLTPTRELAAQIGDNFQSYARFLKLRHRVIFGGVNQRPQVNSLKKGIDILIATPGRLLDLHHQGHIDFDHVDFFVLDEADRMLDMGFIHDIRKVLKLLPEFRQNLLFSATMPDSIVTLASDFLKSPIRVEVNPQSTTVELIAQKVMFVERSDKRKLLRQLLENPDVESAIVFTRTKHGANRVAKDISKAGVEVAAIHGNKSQAARQRALAGFKSGEIRVLVATDIASRGIDVDGVSHVFNYDLPNIPESYVHRIGRTARAGREGIAIAFCDETETGCLRDIEKLIAMSIERDLEHEWHSDDAMNAPPTKQKQRQRQKASQKGKPTNNRGKGAPKAAQKGGASDGGDSKPSKRRKSRRPGGHWGGKSGGGNKRSGGGGNRGGGGGNRGGGGGNRGGGGGNRGGGGGNRGGGGGNRGGGGRQQ